MAEQKERSKLSKAVAINYDAQTDRAPIVTAIGVGPTAEKIKELAEQHKIPVYKEENLVKALRQLEIGEEVPVELYAVMAEILAWVFMLEEKKKG